MPQKTLKLYIPGCAGTRFKAGHNKDRTVLTVTMVRKASFPARYYEGHGPLAQETTFSFDVNQELDGSQRFVDGRKFARTHDEENGVHTLVFLLEELSSDSDVEFGELG